jgi:5,10-methylenetetrahydromethanopterin reductase
MVETNRWDPAPLAAFRADAVVGSVPGAIDQLATDEQLQHIEALLPPDWMAAAATGTPDQCVDTVLRQFELGCNGVILHGVTPTEVAPVVDAYRPRRPEAVTGYPANPGRSA